MKQEQLTDFSTVLSARRRSFPHGRAGNAGIMATVAIAFAGLIIGALSAYLTERGAGAEAARTSLIPSHPSKPSTADDGGAMTARARIVADILTSAAAPERLAPPSGPATYFRQSIPAAPKPKIVIILDDMGIDRRATERALRLPGPLTFSFLPYVRDVDRLAEAAASAGGEVMLHLPMQPEGGADPGPKALKTGMTGGEFLQALDWNLNRFDNYVGVNNHMGSRLTTDLAAMKTLLGHLDHKGVFFLDSVTTSHSAVSKAAQEIGVEVFARDVFLDAETGSEDAVKQQLALAERIAKETGYVVAIGHPHEETLNVLGPWLTTAPARGFELVFASGLRNIRNSGEAALVKKQPKRPDLRL